MRSYLGILGMTWVSGALGLFVVTVSGDSPRWNAALALYLSSPFIAAIVVAFIAGWQKAIRALLAPTAGQEDDRG